MRPIGNYLRQTIVNSSLLATVLLALPVSNVRSQAPVAPSGTGVKQPSNEELIEKANKSSVKADAIWIEMTSVGESPSRLVVDLNRHGSCYVIHDTGGVRSIYGGSGIPAELLKRAFTSLTKRSVIYGDRLKTVKNDKREMVAIGMATWDGSRVYKTQSGGLASFPDEVQKIVTDLKKVSEHLPVSQSMGSIQSTFLRPDETRRLMEGGKKIINVEDPGDIKQMTTIDMAVRMPGRDIVVPTADHWEVLQTYVLASNPKNQASGEFYVQSSKGIVYRIKMDTAVAPDDGLEDGLDNAVIPRAKPVEKGR